MTHDPLRAARELRAPQSLRARVAAERIASPPPSGRRRGRLLAVGALAALALFATSIVLLAAGGGDPTFDDAARAALTSPSSPAPATRPDGRLDLAVGDLWFPGAERANGWRPVGAHAATLDGRRAPTVTYAKEGRIVAYMIVDGTPLDLPDGIDSSPYTVLKKAGATVVTWRRDGRTCVLVSRNAGAKRLLDFAAGVY